MRHYSNQPRPPSGEALALGTGDFEAVGYPAIPTAPRVPSFHRSVASPQAGFGYPAHYVTPPPAAHSLSPVAMSAVADAAATGPQRAQPVVVRSRPNAKTGMAIVAAGALIGAVFGIGVRVRDAGAAATLAAEQAPAPQQEAPVPAQPVAAPVPVAPVVVASGAGAPAPTPPSAGAPARNYAGVPFGSLVVAPPPAPTAEAPKPRAKRSWGKPAGARPSVAAKAKATAPKAKDKTKDDGYTVASAGKDAPKAAKKADKPEKVEKVTKPAKSRKGMDEADRLLKEAMGATENTL